MRTPSRGPAGRGSSKETGALQAKVRADVAAYGWHVLKVLSDTGTAPPFAYTIGLDTIYRHPEVVIFGLNGDLDFMHRVLNHIGQRVAKGERFEHGAKKPGILPGFVCPFARFPRDAYDDHLGQAQLFYGPSRFRAVQCIWPDPKKRLPWDPRVLLPVLARQPIFLRPNAGPKDPPWPFSESRSRHIITSRQVATGKEPFRYVGRFRDGDWQFVCNTTSEKNDIVLATLGWALDRDPSLREAARLRPGQSIVRSGPRGRWTNAAVDE
jgi:hypothetical protein